MRWAGKLGFALAAVETETGVYAAPVTEFNYKGEILRESRGSNNNLPNQSPFIRMAISVIPGDLLRKNIASIRYATYMDQKWSVTGFEVQGGRYILNLGDRYE